jgi:DNA-binding CsgD family transcriptional regulator
VHLSPRDGDRILKLLPDLYAHAVPTQFFESSLSLLQDFLGCDHCAWFDYEFTGRPRLKVTLSRGYDLDPHVLSQMEEALPSHPYIAHYQTHAMTAIRLSDLPRRLFLAHRDRYEDVYRRADIHHEMTLPLAMSPHWTRGVSVRRSIRDFTERDRTVLDLLQPHLRRAYANAQIVGDPDETTLISTSAMQFDLTYREAQVAFWLAQGKTNGEIGLILGIGTRTAEKHVEHILAKLDVENRTTAALQLRR